MLHGVVWGGIWNVFCCLTQPPGYQLKVPAPPGSLLVVALVV
jgi:hypothetical protein